MKTIELTTHEIAKRSGISNEMAVQSALYLLEKANHITRGSFDKRTSPTESVAPWERMANNSSAGANDRTRRVRTIVMLDSVPVAKLRINPGEVARSSISVTAIVVFAHISSTISVIAITLANAALAATARRKCRPQTPSPGKISAKEVHLVEPAKREQDRPEALPRSAW
jgi:hypothetical protein